MKKLLLILLCLPLLFSTCKKEDEEPTNTGNNNTGNFLENQDGTIWILNNNNAYREFNEPEEFGAIYCPEIGFYNSDYFMMYKDDRDSLNWGGGSMNCCEWYFEGLVFESPTLNLSITKHTDVELWIEIGVWGDSEEFPADPPFATIEHQFTLISDNQLKIITKISDNSEYASNDYFSDNSSSPQYIKSTETNLSCN